MKYPEPSFSIKVDVANPGQFFACCGLLELAHRLWPSAEGWFDLAVSTFLISCRETIVSFEELIHKLAECDITGLSEAEHQEREYLETECRRLKKQGENLSENIEQRRKELGTLAREGPVRLGQPFNITLDWWQRDDNDLKTPKTWAGRQEIHKVVRAAQDALMISLNPGSLLNHSCVMYMPREYQKTKMDHKKAVEPFYFDSRRFAHALDAGFSLDEQDAETLAHPAVELLSLIGIQRFRPAPSASKWAFEYLAWLRPLSVTVAAVGLYCEVLPGARFTFQLRFRDDQKRYKAFGYAIQMGG